MVDIHTKTNTYHIDILREFYRVQKDSLTPDLRKGGDSTQDINGSVMLNYINDLYQKAITLREQTFNPKKGIDFIKPNKTTFMGTTQRDYRKAFSLHITTDQGTNGLKNSGLMEQVKKGKATDINKRLRDRFGKVWSKSLHLKWSTGT